MFTSILTILSIYWIFLPLLATEKLYDVNIYKITSAVFWLGIILNRLLKNCIELLILGWFFQNEG